MCFYTVKYVLITLTGINGKLLFCASLLTKGIYFFHLFFPHSVYCNSCFGPKPALRQQWGHDTICCLKYIYVVYREGGGHYTLVDRWAGHSSSPFVKYIGILLIYIRGKKLCGKQKISYTMEGRYTIHLLTGGQDTLSVKYIRILLKYEGKHCANQTFSWTTEGRHIIHLLTGEQDTRISIAFCKIYWNFTYI